MFGPLLPSLEAEFQIGHAQSTSYLLFMSVGYALSTLLSGFTVSQVSPKLMVSASVFLCGVTLLGISQVQNSTSLALLLFVLGITAGHYFNGGLSTMRNLVPPQQWSTAIAVHELGPNLSFVFGPILGALAEGWLGWRGVTMSMGIFSMLAGLVFFCFARGGGTVAPPFSLHGIRNIIFSPKLWLFTWLMALSIAGEFAPYSVLSLHLMEDRHLSAEVSALLLSTSRIAAPFAVLGGGWVTVRLGMKRTLIFCFSFYALGMMLMASPWLPVAIAGMFIQPVSTAMAFPPVFTYLATSFPAEKQPLLLALGMPMASFVGMGVMSSLLGFWGEHFSFQAGFFIMGCLVAASLPLLCWRK